jgi:hypothetical protein
MAKIIGPMHSDNAMGLYGGRRNGVVYSRWNRVSYTRALAIDPADPHTLDQLHMRATLCGCAQNLLPLVAGDFASGKNKHTG